MNKHNDDDDYGDDDYGDDAGWTVDALYCFDTKASRYPNGRDETPAGRVSKAARGKSPGRCFLAMLAGPFDVPRPRSPSRIDDPSHPFLGGSNCTQFAPHHVR